MTTQPGTAWRFSLEDPHSGQLRHFPDMEALIAALQQELIELEEAASREERSLDA